MPLMKTQEQKAAEARQRERLLLYKRAFATSEGKEVLFDLMDRYHMLRTHGGDPFKEGQRSVIVHILNQCNVSVEKFDAMCRGEA